MMINIQKLIEEANENGYHGDKASAKVCQDIVLKALSIGPLSRNVTIKGGVVMRSKTNNVRRATQDLDIDFIKYSLADESIDAFISKLNCLDGIKISRLGKIEELKQQDYSGKIGKFSKQDIRDLCPSLSISSVEGSLRTLVNERELMKGGSGKATYYVRLKQIIKGGNFVR